MANKALLKFTKNETYNIKIENILDMNKSIFIDNYINAYKIFNTLLVEKKRNYNFNNIIAFLGERGSGKTSCMQSFIDSLDGIFQESLDSLDKSELKVQLEKYNRIIMNNKKIKKMTIIEPTFFSKEINILELVISNMFKEFNKELMKDMSEKYGEKKSLLKKFQDIYKSMKYMKCSEAYKSSEIEELVQLSTAVSFKESFEELVSEYLKFFNKFKLVISIDDIDLNTEYAYEMTEDIRKYLSIDNIIIVMALKLEQLKTVVVKNYVVENSELVRSIDYKDRIIVDIENRAEKYLLKLIPVERRLYLKDLDEYKCEFEISIDGIEIDSQNKDFQKIILKYIYQKIGVLFLPSEFLTNMIIPTNFREFVGFLVTLSKLENIEENKSEEEIKRLKKENYLKFKDYFFNYFIKQKIYIQKEYEYIQRLMKSDWAMKKDIFLPLEKGRFGYNSNYEEGTILSVIDKLKKENIGAECKFALKTIYSFFLYETHKIYSDEGKYLMLLGKNYLSTKKFNLFELEESKLKENKISKLLGLFFIKEETNISGNKKYVFSVFAPYYNYLIKEEVYEDFKSIIKSESLNPISKNFDITFRNMDLFERFYNFLEKISVDRSIKASEIIKDIYMRSLPEFISKIEILEENKKLVIINSLKEIITDELIEEIGKIENLIEIKDEQLKGSGN